MLRDLDLFHDLADTGTIPGAVLAADANLLGAFTHGVRGGVCKNYRIYRGPNIRPVAMGRHERKAEKRAGQ